MTTATFTRNVWSGVANANRETYHASVTELVYRSRLLMAKLRKGGRLKTGMSGDHLAWVYRYKQAQPIQYGDGNPITFPRNQYHAQAVIDWNQYIAPDSITEHEKRMNRGDAALVKLAGTKMAHLMESMQDFFNNEGYGDGSGAMELDGLESMFGTGTTVAADIVAQPSDTYAANSTAVAQGASTWTSGLSTSPNAAIATDWPHGNGSADYDFWSPLIVNDGSPTGWGTSSSAWEDNCLPALRFMVEIQKKRCGAKAVPDLYMSNSKRCIELKNRLEQRFQTNTPHKEAEDLGFPGTPQYEGVAIYTDFNCPEDTSYLLSTKALSICTLTNRLFESYGPQFELDRMADIMLVNFDGNMRFESPKFFAKSASIASS